MRLTIKLALVIICTGMLSACGTMNSSFDCPNKAGVSCKSLDQVNSMVDNGQIRGDGEYLTKTAHWQANFEPYPMIPSYSPGEPLRYGETVQRIWVSPYEDIEGNYHQDSTIYTIIKGGHWIGKPPKAFNQN